MTKPFPSLLLPLCLALLAGCSAPSTSASNTGSAQLAASVSQALAAPISRVSLTVSGADFPSFSVDLVSSNGSWGGVVGNIPAGSNRTFVARAFDSSGNLVFQGQTSGVTITANQTIAVALTLQEVAPPPPYGNEAPLIESLVASATSVQPGGSLSLTAAVRDPNAGDTLTLAWTASGGSFSAPSAAATSWTAPASTGVQTLRLTVTDSQGAAVSVALTVNVTSGTSSGNAGLTISFNLWPVVSRVSASLNRLDAGQSTAVSTLASDADGDALSYLWTSSCPGTWTNAASSAASFVPSSIPAGACNNCRLTVTVQDGRGGQTTGTINLCIASSAPQRFPPQFTNSYQSSSSASPGQQLTFSVTAMDPQSSSMTFAWTATAGTLGAPANGASNSQLTWTAPACVAGSTSAGITATVTNAFNLTATKSFTVTGLPSCATTGWASTGSMAAPRHNHTATLLSTGKLLISGGDISGGTTETAEVYDPASGTWSATGAMAVPRRFHTATPLTNGKVLVVGGEGDSGTLATATLYDPASGTWSVTGSMAAPRAYHTATRLSNGKVLVSGGRNSTGDLATADVYDPASGTWSTTSPMTMTRWNHGLTLLNSGKVLASGGSNTSAAAELYDPASGTWSATGSMTMLRSYQTATLLNNGKVLISGGSNSNGYLAAAELYDPASGLWTATGTMTWYRLRHTATLLPNGKVLAVGGFDGASIAAAEVYDPAVGTWSAAGSLATARRIHTATLLNNGKVLVSGGIATSGVTATAELYTP